MDNKSNSDEFNCLAREAVRLIAGGLAGEVDQGLILIRQAIDGGINFDGRDEAGLRLVDALARGCDSEQAALAMQLMAESGFEQEMLAAPGASDMPPMMAACFAGNAKIVQKLLELGMPGDVKANASSHKILAGTPFHAAVIGYRKNRQDDYAQVLSCLLQYCPDGINVADRLRQKPIDWATKIAAATGDFSLADAMMEFGVSLNGGGALGADKVLKVIAQKSGDNKVRALMASSEARLAIREIEAMRGGAPSI